MTVVERWPYLELVNVALIAILERLVRMDRLRTALTAFHCHRVSNDGDEHPPRLVQVAIGASEGRPR